MSHSFFNSCVLVPGRSDPVYFPLLTFYNIKVLRTWSWSSTDENNKIICSRVLCVIVSRDLRSLSRNLIASYNTTDFKLALGHSHALCNERGISRQAKQNGGNERISFLLPDPSQACFSGQATRLWIMTARALTQLRPSDQKLVETFMGDARRTTLQSNFFIKSNYFSFVSVCKKWREGLSSY